MLIYCRIWKANSTRLKELRQKRILAKLKKINEKRRKYHSVSTEGKVTLCTNSETTTMSLTSSKSADNYKDLEERLDATIRPTEIVTEAPKIYTSTVNNPVGEGSEAYNSNSVTKVSGVMKLCGSPVRINDTIKGEIHKLLQEEKPRTITVGNAEQSNRTLKIQSNFEAGLSNLHSPNGQSPAERNPLASPVSSNTLSTSSSSAVIMSPLVSKTASKASRILEESDDEDNDIVSKELKMLDAIVASKHEEELVAKKSRERMLKAYSSVEKSNIGMLGGTKKSSIDYATAEMSPMVWYGLIEERRKKWLTNHSLWKYVTAFYVLMSGNM